MRYQVFDSENPGYFICGFEYDGAIQQNETIIVGDISYYVAMRTHRIMLYTTKKQQACDGSNICELYVTLRG